MVSVVTTLPGRRQDLLLGELGVSCAAPLGEDAGGRNLASTPCAFSLCCFWSAPFRCNKSEPQAGRSAVPEPSSESARPQVGSGIPAHRAKGR